MPAVKIERYTREQITHFMAVYDEVPPHACQLCGGSMIVSGHNYCPMCGAELEWINRREK